MKKLLFTMMICLGLTACGGETSSTTSVPTPTPPNPAPAVEQPSAPTIIRRSGIDMNVAASSLGAVATATYNSATAANINDESDSTTWISDPDSPLIINFGTVDKINKITIKKVASSVSARSNPGILVELSVDGKTYVTSDITTSSEDGVPCNSSRLEEGVLECSMDDHWAQYIKITSKNGLSFEFKEVIVNSFIPTRIIEPPCCKQSSDTKRITLKKLFIFLLIF